MGEQSDRGEREVGKRRTETYMVSELCAVWWVRSEVQNGLVNNEQNGRHENGDRGVEESRRGKAEQEQ